MLLGWRARRRFGAIEVFVLSTAAVILVYSGGVSRFWIAALPFIIAYALTGLGRLARFKLAKPAIILYACVFAVVGGAWLIESVRVSVSGRDFLRVAASSVDAGLLNARVAASYRVAFGEARPGDTALASAETVKLLQRHEPLARDGSG
jgi:hypothetical protein